MDETPYWLFNNTLCKSTGESTIRRQYSRGLFQVLQKAVPALNQHPLYGSIPSRARIYAFRN